MSDSPLTNREWGRMVIDGLRQLGVQRFFMSPGARSSPLIAALAETDDVSVTIHYDERGMSFAALGHAMATGLPRSALQPVDLLWLIFCLLALRHPIPAYPLFL